MTDWNKEPRSTVEAAAAAGDESAQTALRLHQSLDRIEVNIESLREGMHQSFDALQADLNALHGSVTKKRRGFWLGWFGR